MTKQGVWVKIRRQPTNYKLTEQQRKIAKIGQAIKEVCTGKKGKEFVECRAKVIEGVLD